MHGAVVIVTALIRSVSAAGGLSLPTVRGGQRPQAMRAWCGGSRYCPDPLGIVPGRGTVVQIG